MGSRICPIRESLVRTGTYYHEFIRERKLLVTYKNNAWIGFFLQFVPSTKATNNSTSSNTEAHAKV